MTGGTFKSVDHSSGGVSSIDVDLRPLIVAIRELTAKLGGGSLEPSDTQTVVTMEPPVVNVTVPEPVSQPVTVSLPEMQPEIVVNVPEVVPQVTVHTQFPTGALIFFGLTNSLALLAIIIKVFFRG
jgi:hypothetical protein